MEEIMKTARWKGKIIARSDTFISLEGNIYFPPESVDRSFLGKSTHNTTCPWKGEASYYDVIVDGESNKNAAWYYPAPKEKAAHIRDYVAFWNGVDISDD